jgi:hydroxybutyrate-dimer hydrolase
MMLAKRGSILVKATLAAAVAAISVDSASAAPPPSFITGGVIKREFGVGNDLLTAGLGWSGIANGVAPAASDPPTVDELRRLAIWASWRGLISTSANEGFGRDYGTLGPVPGVEYMTAVKGPSGPAAVLLVQIPDRFNSRQPCIVTAPSSGSRGIYGAISNAETAFEHGCAVAYTDKGTGVGFHDLTRDVVYGLGGRARPSKSFALAHFRAPDDAATRSFKTRYPHRIAVKHAHSGQNPEKNWGRFVLQSIQFAIWAINDHENRSWTPAQIRVVAAGVSNGGGAALLAAEQDSTGLIDGVVVSEPQVQPTPRRDFTINDRGRSIAAHSRSLYDVTTFMDVFADCAGVDTNAVTPAPPGVARCAALKNRGLLTAATLDGQVAEARRRIHAYGLLPDADKLLPPHASLHLWRILAPVYGNAYARASLADHLCKTSFASAPGGLVQQWDETAMERAFGNANGLPGLPADLALRPRGNIDIIDDTLSPPRNELVSPNLNLDGALCWRSLATGVDTPTTRLPPLAKRQALRQGIAEVRATGNLRGKPALIFHGRKDALIAPNHSSRAYFGLNRMVEGARSRARYVEVVNGNHFDSFIPLYPALGAPGETLVAMHGYFNFGVERMLQHLASGATLPASQAFAATEETCPLPLTPAPADRIRFENRAVVIPAGGTPAGC